MRPAAVIVLVLLAACATAPDPAALDSSALVRVPVMTFNIRVASATDGENGWQFRRAQVAALIRASGADIVALQEVQGGQRDWLRRELPGFAAVGRSREAGDPAGESIPVFFRTAAWRLDPNQSGTFWLSATPSVPGSATWGNRYPRVVTWCRLLHVETGLGLYVFNVHLDHESENSRRQSAGLLRQRLRALAHDDPVVVLGDFNAEPATAVLRTLTDGDLRDLLREAAFATADAGTFHGFSGDRTGRAIDYILVEPRTTVVDAHIVYDNVEGAYPSDHFPVRATLLLPAMPAH